MHLIFNSADTGEYATDYFANDAGRYTLLIDADVERSEESSVQNSLGSKWCVDFDDEECA